VFLRIRRRDPRRWGNRDKWWRLWAEHKRLTAGTVALPEQLQQSHDRLLAALGHFNLPGHAEAIAAATQQWAATTHNARKWLDADKARLAAAIKSESNSV
jgi:hypothetical protein